VEATHNIVVFFCSRQNSVWCDVDAFVWFSLLHTHALVWLIIKISIRNLSFSLVFILLSREVHIRPHLLDSGATILILLMHLRCMNRKETWILLEIHKNEHRFIGCKGQPPTYWRKSWKKKKLSYKSRLSLVCFTHKALPQWDPYYIWERCSKRGLWIFIRQVIFWSTERIKTVKRDKKHPWTVGFENANSGSNHCLDGCEILFQKVQG
jgi:hypothetical protein